MQFFIAANFLTVYCCNVSQTPRPGEIVLASGLGIEPGGKGLNVAIGTSRLGAQVSALVGIGRDAAGDGLVSLLQSEGVGTDHVHRLADTSGCGFGLIAQDGSNCGAVFAGPNLLLSAAHAALARPTIESADWVYGQFETALPAVQACFELARAAGVPTMLNPSPWQPIPAELLGLTDVLLVNEVEAAQLLQHEVPAQASLTQTASLLDAAVQALWSRWPGRWLVVTLGERGSLAWQRGEAPVLTPAWRVHAVDTLGAGDAFASGLLFKLGQGQALPEALAFASACGAIMAATPGVLGALPTEQTVSTFMASEAIGLMPAS